jgi:hypothetical protein
MLKRKSNPLFPFLFASAGPDRHFYSSKSYPAPEINISTVLSWWQD